MISIAGALDTVLSAVRVRPSEEVPLASAVGRILAEDLRAGFSIPPFANSQMDGFAVRSADLTAASRSRPGELRVGGTVAAGASAPPPVEPGGALRIMTGAPIPTGADAVVKVEDTESAGEVVRVYVAPKPGSFVRPAGEDVVAGDLVLERGRRLRPADIGVAAALGWPVLRVSSRPRLAVLATGDELVPLGQPLTPGRIYNSNAYALAAAALEAGADPTLLGTVGDDREALRVALRAASEFDVAVSTGGVSVGDFDFVKQVMEEIGLERRFWQVAQKPGKPLTFAARDGCLFFGLPGNPVSALVCFELYVAPAIRRSLAMGEVFAATVEVTMAESVATARDLTELVRCRLEGGARGLSAVPTGTQSSGALRSMSLADCLVVSPPGRAMLESGERVTALMLGGDRPLSARHPFV
jgi:molybdopterin molybdotransferase